MNRNLFFLTAVIIGVVIGNLINGTTGIETFRSIYWLSFGYGLCAYNISRMIKNGGES